MIKVKCVDECFISDEEMNEIALEVDKVYEFDQAGPNSWPMIHIKNEDHDDWYDIACYLFKLGSFVDDDNRIIFETVTE